MVATCSINNVGKYESSKSMLKPCYHENIQLKTSVEIAAKNLVKPKSSCHKTDKCDHFQSTTHNVVQPYVNNSKSPNSNMVVTCSINNEGKDESSKAMVKPCCNEKFK